MKITIPSFYWYPCRKLLNLCSSVALQTLGEAHPIANSAHEVIVCLANPLSNCCLIWSCVLDPRFCLRILLHRESLCISTQYQNKMMHGQSPSVAVSQRWLFPSPFPHSQNLCHNQGIQLLLIPATFQPEPAWSLAKDSSFCWAWSWNPWQKAVHIVHTKVFQIADFPGCILLFIYLLTFISVSGCYTGRLGGSPECPQFWYLWPAGH